MKQKKKRNFINNQKRIVGVFAVLFVLFAGLYYFQTRDVTKAAHQYTFTNSNGDTVNSGATMDLRRATDTLTVNEREAGDTYKWECDSPSYLQLTNTTNYTVSMRVQNKVGTVNINLTVTHADGSQEQARLTLNIVFSINEVLTSTTGGNATMDRIFSTDTRRSLIMDTGATVAFGTDGADISTLNLIFGSAKEASWHSTNDDVLKILTDATGKSTGVKATGAGRAVLSVTFNDGTIDYSDEIMVYVRPKILDSNGVVITDPTNTNVTTVKEFNAGDKIGLSVNFANNPLEGVGDKIIWVISKTEGETTVLVRDSLGHVGPDGGEAKLTWLTGEKLYRIDAPSGTYNIQFYVIGTYKDFDSAKEEAPGCRPVSLQANVLADYSDKSVSVNIGGSYSLAEAFNIPEEVLADTNNFTISITDGKDYISRDGVMVEGRKLGQATITVTKKADVTIPGVSDSNPTVIVKITVVETYTLNMSYASMVVGATEELYAVIGSNVSIDGTSIHWTTSDPSYVGFVTSAGESTEAETSGEDVIIKAIKKTNIGEPITITSTWSDENGVHYTAYCYVTVTEAASNFEITPKAVQLNSGESQVLSTGLSGTQNIQWISSDEAIVKAVAYSGNISAQITAGTKTGVAYITAINRDNGAYATCVVTVSAPIQTINVRAGNQDITNKTYNTVLVDRFVQLSVSYTPTNATNATFTWTSYNTDVATVDSKGLVTYVSEGTARIVVKPTSGSNSDVYAECFISINDNPITEIKTDVSVLSMITGDEYVVTTTLVPDEPSDPTLTWSTSDAKIATVNQEGKITAVSAGTAVISITGGLIGQGTPPVTITVNVRDRIQSIEFVNKSTYIAVGSSEQLEVIFTPDTESLDRTLVWKSTDESVVTVSNTGEIYGVQIGIAMVSCYAQDVGPSSMITCMVHVTDEIVKATSLSILPEESTIHVGETLQMQAVFTPADTTNQDVVWKSSLTAVATISADGLVTALTTGVTTITALYTDTPDGQPWIYTSTITVEEAIVEATDFYITPDSKNIKVKESFQIETFFVPENTTDQSVEFYSTNEKAATVSSEGLVTGVTPGEDTMIVATSVSSGIVASCAVHVENAVKFSLSPSSRDIAKGKSFTIKKVISPSNAYKDATWKSSNTRIATVSSSGKVTAKRYGVCTIYCTLTEYNQRATCKVLVSKLWTKVKLDKKSIRIGLNQTYKLKKTVTSNNAKIPAVKWKSSNKKIVTVTSTGKIKGKRVGVAKITAVSKDSIKAKATCKVTVIRRVSSIKMKEEYAVCYVGRTKKLTASAKPKNASIRKLKWTSSNRNIATVNSSGRVTGITEGNVRITAQATDGSGKKAYCYVKVVEPVDASNIVVAQTELTMKKGDSAKLSYTVLPSDTSDHVKFASDNKRVATVDSNGNVKAVGTGNATITLLADSGTSSTVAVNVVSLNKTSLTFRQYDTYTLSVLGTAEKITWYSSNNRVATVNNGVVTGKGKGTTYVYAYVNGCKMSCKVTVTSVSN